MGCARVPVCALCFVNGAVCESMWLLCNRGGGNHGCSGVRAARIRSLESPSDLPSSIRPAEMGVANARGTACDKRVAYLAERVHVAGNGLEPSVYMYSRSVTISAVTAGRVYMYFQTKSCQLYSMLYSGHPHFHRDHTYLHSPFTHHHRRPALKVDT